MNKYNLYVIWGDGQKTHSFLSFHNSVESALDGFNKLKTEWKEQHGIELTNEHLKVFEHLDDIGIQKKRVA